MGNILNVMRRIFTVVLNFFKQLKAIVYVLLDKKKPIRVLLEWPSVHSKFPWGIIFLMGGGYALADASEVSKCHTYYS